MSYSKQRQKIRRYYADQIWGEQNFCNIDRLFSFPFRRHTDGETLSLDRCELIAEIQDRQAALGLPLKCTIDDSYELRKKNGLVQTITITGSLRTLYATQIWLFDDSNRAYEIISSSNITVQ